MRQRVGFARALSLDPQIILMDEPFSSVDEQTRELLQEQLLELWSATGKTIFFITHSIDEAVYMADRVVVMGARPGRIVEEIDVDLPRPRSGGVRALPRFGEIRAYAWEILKKGIRESVRVECRPMTATDDNRTASRAGPHPPGEDRSPAHRRSVTLIGFLTLWEIAGRLSNPLFFAPVSDVLREFWLGLLDPRATPSQWICRDARGVGARVRDRVRPGRGARRADGAEQSRVPDPRSLRDDLLQHAARGADPAAAALDRRRRPTENRHRRPGSHFSRLRQYDGRVSATSARNSPNLRAR